MKELAYIIVLLLMTTMLISQNTSGIKFSLTGIIGIENEVQLQNILVTTDEGYVYTDSVGEFTLNSTMNIIHIKIHHWGFTSIDTILEIHKMDNKIELYMISDCDVNGDLAKVDIEKNEMKLWLIGSVAPTIVIGQEWVSKKYGFEYRDFGCSPPANECIVQYNNLIFRELDINRGKSWRKEIRDDVIGLKEYVAANE